MNLKTKKMGRRPMPEGSAKEVLYAVRVSPVDSDRIERAVTTANQSKAEWLRNALIAATRQG